MGTIKRKKYQRPVLGVLAGRVYVGWRGMKDSMGAFILSNTC